VERAAASPFMVDEEVEASKQQGTYDLQKHVNPFSSLAIIHSLVLNEKIEWGFDLLSHNIRWKRSTLASLYSFQERTDPASVHRKMEKMILRMKGNIREVTS
jgi:hypothetical protein